jgi:hypothetical protein
MMEELTPDDSRRRLPKSVWQKLFRLFETVDIICGSSLALKGGISTGVGFYDEKTDLPYCALPNLATAMTPLGKVIAICG